VEALVHGNDDYTAWQTGIVALGFQPAPHTSMGFKAGARKTSGEDLSGYIGIELGKDFQEPVRVISASRGEQESSE
jgi:hypothetical protein